MKQHLRLFISARRFRVSLLGSFILTAKSSCDSGPTNVLGHEGDKSRSFFFPALEKLALKEEDRLPIKQVGDNLRQTCAGMCGNCPSCMRKHRERVGTRSRSTLGTGVGLS